MTSQFDYKQVYCYIDGEQGGGYKLTPFNGLNLSEFGEAGWELATSVALPATDGPAGIQGAILIFKRQI